MPTLQIPTASKRWSARQCDGVVPPAVDFNEKDSTTEPRWRALGRTIAERRLYLVFTFRETLIRVVAARDMNRKERHDYEQIQARIEKNPT